MTHQDRPLGRTKGEKIIKLLPWVILLAQYVWFIVFYYMNGTHYLDSDTSSGMVLANILNQEGSWVLSGNWYYGSELPILSTQYVNKIALLLFSDWHMARTFSIAVHMLLLFAAYFFFARQAGMKNLGVWAAVLMFCPFSGLYSWVMLVSSMYIPQLILCFVSLGLVLAAAKLAGRRRIALSLVVSAAVLALALLSGMSGIRQILLLYAPFAVAACLMLLVRKASQAAAPASGAWRWTDLIVPGLAALLVVTALAGYYLNVKALSRVYSSDTYSDSALAPFHLTWFLDFLGSVTTIFGYQNYVRIFSQAGIQSLYAIVWFGFLMAMLAAGVYHRKRLSAHQRLLLAYAVASLALNVAFGVLSQRQDPRYLITPAIFCVITADMVIHALPRPLRLYRYLAYAIMILGLSVTYLHPNLDFFPAKDLKGLISATQWLRENGYTQGYAPYWNSNVTTELSSGKIEMWTLNDSTNNDLWKNLQLFDCLQQKDHLSRQPEGKVFVILNEWEYLQEPVPVYAREEYLAYQGHDCYVFTYSSAQELYSLVEPEAGQPEE